MKKSTLEKENATSQNDNRNPDHGQFKNERCHSQVEKQRQKRVPELTNKRDEGMKILVTLALGSWTK